MGDSQVQGTLLYINLLFNNIIGLKTIFQNGGSDKGTAMLCSVKISNLTCRIKHGKNGLRML